MSSLNRLARGYVFIAWKRCRATDRVVATIVGALTTLIATLLLYHIEKRRGYLCRDAHKPVPTYVPCSCGAAVGIGFLASMSTLYAYHPDPWYLAAALSVAVGMVVGILDDLFDLRPLLKICLASLVALPILALGTYVPRPWVPFVGYARLTIVYPLLIVLLCTVIVNGFNMIDTHNGVMPFAGLSLSLGAFLALLVHGDRIGTDIALAALIVLATYLPFNLYPAKLFNGNAGSFTIGAIASIVAIECRLESFAVLALAPMMINGFLYLVSAKGFKQKQNVRRPTIVDNGSICSSPDPEAPITFVRLVVSHECLDEKRLVIALYASFAVSTIIALTVELSMR